MKIVLEKDVESVIFMEFLNLIVLKVQSLNFFLKRFGGTTTKFTWIGGEDKSSLVLGTGRPFFVKIQNPVKRNLKVTTMSFDALKITDLKIVHESPKKPLIFNSSIKMKISTDSEIKSKHLKKLIDFTKQPIVVYEKSGKRTEKKILAIISTNGFL